MIPATTVCHSRRSVKNKDLRRIEHQEKAVMGPPTEKARRASFKTQRDTIRTSNILLYVVRQVESEARGKLEKRVCIHSADEPYSQLHTPPHRGKNYDRTKLPKYRRDV